MKKTVLGILWASYENSVWFLGYAVVVLLIAYATRRAVRSMGMLIEKRWQKRFFSGFSSTKVVVKGVLYSVAL